MPAMLILLTSISTLARRSNAMIAIPSLSLMLSSKTTSSGKRTLRLPGFCRANTLALRDMAVSYPCLCNLCKIDLPSNVVPQIVCTSRYTITLAARIKPLFSTPLCVFESVCVNRWVDAERLLLQPLHHCWLLGWGGFERALGIQRCCKAGRAGLGAQGQ